MQTSRVEDQLSQKCVMVAETLPFFSFFPPACATPSTDFGQCGWIFLLVPVELKGCVLLAVDVTTERLLWGLHGRPRSCVLRINSIKIILPVCILL